MGWAVGWDFDHNRWLGYGVPAYCDAGCGAEIDRGLGCRCECWTCLAIDDILARPKLFVCGDHTHTDVDEDSLPPEHPDWVKHLLTDDSWAQWRAENPAEVGRLRQESDR